MLGLLAKLCPTLVTLWTVACQAPLSMGFPKEEYWNGLLFPSPGDFSNPGIELRFPTWQVDFLFVSFLFFKINLFNWRIITLQYCGGFCHTLT